MKTREVYNLLYHFAANYIDIPIELVGPPGCGKTSIARQVIRDLNANGGADVAAYCEKTGREVPGERTELCLTIRELSSFMDADVRGVLVPQKQELPSGQTVLVGRWTWPVSLPDIDAPEFGVLFLDEFGQCPPDIQKTCGTLLLEGRMGDYRTAHLRWAASNRLSDRAGVARRLTHLRNRMMSISVDHDLSFWTDWAVKVGLHPMAIGFAQFAPATVFTDVVPDGDGPYATPRSFEFATNTLVSRAEPGSMDLPTDPIAHECVAAWIGQGAAADFMAFLKFSRFLPKYEQILDDPKGTPIPEELGVCHATVGMLLQRVDKKNIGQLMDYIIRMPEEFQCVLMTGAVTKTGAEILSDRRFAQWARDHQELVLSVRGLTR